MIVQMLSALLPFVLALLVVLPVAQAQQAKKVAHVGYLAAVSAAADAPRAEAFRQGLRDLGYIEGQNITIEYRYEARTFERLPELAAELVRLKIDVLVTVTTNAAIAGKNAAGTVPLVFMGVTDPVGAGLVESLARPGGNRTGITNIASALTAKRLELLKRSRSQAVPGRRLVGSTWSGVCPAMEREPGCGGRTAPARFLE